MTDDERDEMLGRIQKSVEQANQTIGNVAVFIAGYIEKNDRHIAEIDRQIDTLIDDAVADRQEMRRSIGQIRAYMENQSNEPQ